MARSRRGSPPSLLILDRARSSLLPVERNAPAPSCNGPWNGTAWVEVPVVVLAETTRGTNRDAAVNRVVKAVGAVPDTRRRWAGGPGRCSGAPGARVADALVVAHAVEAGGGLILTSDPDDLGALASGHPGVWVESV